MVRAVSLSRYAVAPHLQRLFGGVHPKEELNGRFTVQAFLGRVSYCLSIVERWHFFLDILFFETENPI